MIEITLLDLIVQFVLLFGMIVAAIFAVVLRDLLAAVLSATAMSVLLAMEFYMLHAPDVAIAEVAVGAGVVLPIFIFAISKTKREEEA
ncbi:MAG: DUF4040 domain-containing protein [Euryarchaeota archaeon]|nr:DUF4040 domain-containing protein [Euryarchaeota archaeon]